MELLIPGLILVALMVYASTRIKKAAAEAYEAETVETDEFVIKKPEGFLNVIGGDPQFAFESYSREFGGPGAEEFKKAMATLQIYEGTSEHEVVARVLDSEGSIVSDLREIVAERRYRVIEARSSEKGVEFRDFYKIAQLNSKSYELKVSVLAETTAEFIDSIQSMLDSFKLKSNGG